MATRSPRTRRRATGTPLPRPTPSADGPLTASPAMASAPVVPAAGRPSRGREHHVTNDFSYVRGDLLSVGVIGVVVLGFIVALSFFV